MGLNVSVGLCRQGAMAIGRAGHARPARPARGLRGAERARAAAAACSMGPVVPFLSDSPAQLEAAVSADRGGRRHAGHADRAAPAPGHPRLVLRLAAGAVTPAWSAATSTCTAGAPTRRRPTRPGSRARCASSRTSTASACPGPVSVTAAARRPPGPRSHRRPRLLGAFLLLRRPGPWPWQPRCPSSSRCCDGPRAAPGGLRAACAEPAARKTGWPRHLVPLSLAGDQRDTSAHAAAI